MKKLSEIILKIFAVGIVVSLFAGGASLLGYIIALLIGGETATLLCTFVFKTYLPWVIKFPSIFTGLGLVGMYLTKQKSLTSSSNEEH